MVKLTKFAVDSSAGLKSASGPPYELLSPIIPSIGLFGDLWDLFGFEKRIRLINTLNNFSFSDIHYIRALISKIPKIHRDALIKDFSNASPARLDLFLKVLVGADFDPMYGKCRQNHTFTKDSTALTPSQTALSEWNTLPTPSSPQYSNTSTSQEILELQGYLGRLPREIYMQVGDSFLISAFLPGKVFPENTPSSASTLCAARDEYEAPNPGALAASKEPQAIEWADRFWSQNVWVIQNGLPCYSLEFLSTISEENLYRIKMVELAFTIRDNFESRDLYGTLARRFKIKKYLSTMDGVWLLDCFRQECKQHSFELSNIWWSKFCEISKLDLSSLTLDFTEAFSPDGEFLGLEFANTLPAFSHGCPDKLQILAPSQILQDDLQAIFRRINP